MFLTAMFLSAGAICSFERMAATSGASSAFGGRALNGEEKGRRGLEIAIYLQPCYYTCGNNTDIAYCWECMHY